MTSYLSDRKYNYTHTHTTADKAPFNLLKNLSSTWKKFLIIQKYVISNRTNLSKIVTKMIFLETKPPLSEKFRIDKKKRRKKK